MVCHAYSERGLQDYGYSHCKLRTYQAFSCLTVQLPNLRTVQYTFRNSEETGRTKSYHVREALEEYIQDMEDVCIAEKRLEDIRAGRSRTYTLEEVEAELGLGD